MECLSSRREPEAPGGRARENRKFIQAPSPEIWSETISGGEEVLAGKWGGLFLGYLLSEKNASSTREIDAAFVSLLQKRADALIVSPDPLFDSRRVLLVTLATHHRLPTAYPFRENV